MSVLAGALALIVLEVVVSNKNAAAATGGVFDGIAGFAEAFLSPDVPGVPDRAHPAAKGSSSTQRKLITSGGAGAGVAAQKAYDWVKHQLGG